MLRGEDDDEPHSPTRLVERAGLTFQPSSASSTNGFGSKASSTLTTPISMPNPAAQPTWFLAKDPDPMMQALLENMLAIEASLTELKMKAKLFQDSIAFLSRTMSDQAACVARLCEEDATLALPTMRFSIVSSNIANESFVNLCELLELKVYQPIDVNLSILNEIKARAHERDALRKVQKSLKSPSSPSNDYVNLTARLFEELAALKKHRYDVIRGIYEGLKQSQRKFFTSVGVILSATDLDPPPKTLNDVVEPPLRTSNPVVSPATQLANVIPVTSQKKEAIILAMPVTAKFDPAADKVKGSSALAFSRFTKELDDDCDDDNVDDFEEYQRNKLNKAKIKTASSPTKSEKPPKIVLDIDENDKDEFDTV